MINFDFEPVVDTTVFNRRDISQYFSHRFTSDLKLGSLINNLLSPAFDLPHFERLVGWIGEDDQIDNNFYYKISESTPDREHYQISPFVISTDDNNNILSAVHYIDIFNNLKAQGSLTGNLNRLIKSKNKSWCPPINPDMLVNFVCYTWSPFGTQIFEIHEQTNIYEDLMGKTNASISIENEGETEILEIQNGMRFRFYNDKNEDYNDIVFLVVGVGTSIELLDDRDFGDIYEIESRDVLEEYTLAENEIDKIYTIPRVESTKLYNIKGEITLFKWSNNDNKWVELDSKTISEQIKPDYVTIERNSLDYNDWSRTNRWFNSVLFNNDKVLYSYYSSKAYHQIIEFKRNKKLYNCGVRKVETVDCYYEGNLSALYGLGVGSKVSGVKMYDGMKILVKDINSSALEQVYEVFGLNIGMSSLSLLNITFDDNDEVYVKGGNSKTGLLYWKTNKFLQAQNKNDNEYPLFDLYDTEYGSLAVLDSEFKGSKLFGYKEDKYITFVNYMLSDLKGKEGYFYDFAKDKYENFLLETEKDIESNYIQYFKVVDPRIKQFSLEIVPDSIVSVYVNTVELNASKYSFNPPIVTVNQTLYENDIIKIVFKYKGVVPDNLQEAFLEVSRVITTSPDNLDIQEIEYSVLLSQMIDIISNQEGFNGNPYAQNNYSSTAQDISIGTKLFNSYSRFNKLAIINNMDNVDVRSVIMKISEKYEEFKRRFVQRVEQIANTNEFNEYSNITDVVATVLKYLNLGKLEGDAFYNSGVISNNSYIPATPSFLGMLPCVEPYVEGRYLHGHDGSITYLKFGDWRDNALVELEQQIYESINSDFKNTLGVLEYKQYIPTYGHETDYTYEEYIEIMNKLFAKWFFLHPEETFSNLNYSEDPFTWNWSSCKDFNGNNLLGHYRGIYNYFYGTYRPDICPWEMLGFYNKPDWWEETYGEAPYTSNNLVMWGDIADGIIRHGPNAGTYDYLKRPYLLDIIPTNEDGELLPPNLNGITNQSPIYQNAIKGFRFGDGSDAEYDWWQTSEYQYALMCCVYLMKPGYWLEYTWDTTSYKGNYQLSSTIHNLVVDGKYQKVIGSAQWVSDYLVLNGIAISTLDKLLQNVEVKIGYRLGSYLDSGNLTIKNTKDETLLSSYYNIITYKSATIKSASLSVMNIAWVDGKYIIYGNDVNNPYFNIFTPEENNNYTYDNSTVIPITYFKTWYDNGEKIPYYTTVDTVQKVYNIIRGYGKYLNSIGFIYETYDTGSQLIINWEKMAKNFLQWCVSSEREDRDVLTLAPWNIINDATSYPYSYISFKNDFGVVDNVCSFTNNTWNIIDIEGNALLSDDFGVYRQYNGVIIQTKDLKQIGYLNLKVYTQENAIIFETIQDNGYIMYDKTNGAYIKNLYLESVRTAVWDGGLYSPGLILNDESLIYNYTKRAYNFKDYYNIDSVTSVEPLGLVAKSITGYARNILLNNIFANENSEFNFYNAGKLEKGSFNVVKALRRLPNMEKLDVLEIFALLDQEYGAITNYKEWEIKVNPTWNINNPQIFTINTFKSYKEFLEVREQPKVETDILYATKYEQVDIYGESEEKSGYFISKNYFSPLGFNWHNELKVSIDTVEDELRTIIYCTDKNIPSLYIKDQSIIMVLNNDFDNPVLVSDNLRLGDAYYFSYGWDGEKYFLFVSNDNENFVKKYYRPETHEIDIQNSTLYIGTKGIVDGQVVNPWFNGKIYLMSYDNSLDENIKEYKKQKANLIYNNSEEWIKQTEFNSDNRFKKIQDESKYTFLPYIPLIREDEVQYKIVTKDELETLLSNNDIKSTDRILVTFDNTSVETNDSSWDLLQLKELYHIAEIEYKEEVDLYENTAVFRTVEKHNLHEGQLISIKSGREEPETWEGVQTVLNVSDDYHFSITTTIQKADTFEDGVVPSISCVISRKFDNPTDLFEDVDNLILKSTIESPEVSDIFVVKGDNYTLYKINENNEVFLLRKKEPKIDTKLIQQVLVYDEKNPLEYKRYDIYDPYKYLIDLESQKNIKYLNYKDPAIYAIDNVTQVETSLDNWTDSHIGDVWWDISQCKYYDYEIEDDEYKAKMWGKLAYGSELKIYEWVKSPVAPTEYLSIIEDDTEVQGNKLSGNPYSVLVDGTEVFKYNVKKEYDEESKTEQIWYYFWVENTKYVPNIINRTLSTSSIALRINADVNKTCWFAPISSVVNPDLSHTSSFIMANVDDLQNEDNILQIKFELKENDFPLHKDWIFFHKSTNESKYLRHWNKFKDSISGYTEQWNYVPNLVLNEYNKYGNRYLPNQSIFVDRKDALRSLIQKINDMLYVQNLDSSQVNEFNVENKPIIQVDENFIYQPISKDYINFVFKVVVSPEQSYKMSEYSNYKKVDTNNSSDLSYWQFVDAEEKDYIRFDSDEKIINYPDIILDTYEDMEEYLSITIIDKKTYFYIKNDKNNNYGWSIYETDDGYDIKLFETQMYKMSDYFEYIDYYSPDVPNFNIIQATFENITELNQVIANEEYTPNNGDLIKLLHANDDLWSIIRYDISSNSWTTVAMKNGTIQITDAILNLDITDPLSETSKLYALIVRNILTLFED